MTVVWSVAVVVFLIIEGATAGLASIWFALGAIAALIGTLFGAPVWLQIVWFVLVSGVTLAVTRPLVKKYVNTRTTPTNADRLIGLDGVVTECVDNLSGTGLVSMDGKAWTARAVSDELIEAGTRVTVSAIEGVKLIVEPAAAAADITQ